MASRSLETRIRGLRKLTEAELQTEVFWLCEQNGLKVQHIPRADRTWLPGWPDLVIFGTGILWRELKSHTGILYPHQRRVGSLITAGGGDWCVWRPRDLVDGTIERQLRAICAQSLPGN